MTTLVTYLFLSYRIAYCMQVCNAFWEQFYGDKCQVRKIRLSILLLFLVIMESLGALLPNGLFYKFNGKPAECSVWGSADSGG